MTGQELMPLCSQSRGQRKASDCMAEPGAVKEPRHELAGNRNSVEALFKRSHLPGAHGLYGMSFAYFRIFGSTAKQADRSLLPSEEDF